MSAYDVPPQRRDNGLRADAFVPLADVDPRLGDHLLDLLKLAEIAAYLEPPSDPRVTVSRPSSGPVERLYVEAEQRGAAREVVLAAAEEAGDPVATPDEDSPGPTRPDILAGIDTDAEFRKIMAGFDDSPGLADLDEHADLYRAAAASAGRTWTPAEEADVEEHFEPPPPPPLPIPAAATVGAVLLIVLGLLCIVFGTDVGFPGDFTFPFGIILMLTGAGVLIARLREHNEADDSGDDGAVV